MKENEEVKKAQSVLHEMSEDEKLQRLAELREKWDRDERSAREYYKNTAFKEGRAAGMQAGMHAGMQAGIEKKQKEIAKKMKEMNMNIEDIEKATGLTKEEIEKL